MKILLLEDDPILSQTMIDFLEDEGYSVDWVSDGEAALDASYEQSYDLYLFDVNVPLLNGFELLKALRDAEDMTPTFFITALVDINSLGLGFEVGADDYVKKPFSMEELILRIENLLKLTGSSSPAKDNIPIGNYNFHPQSMILVIDNEEIRLSHRENEIIKMLYTGRNKRIERKEILMEIWGDDSFFNSRNLDVYMRKIRTYFQKDQRVKIITLKGVGYHFYVES